MADFDIDQLLDHSLEKVKEKKTDIGDSKKRSRSRSKERDDRRDSDSRDKRRRSRSRERDDRRDSRSSYSSRYENRDRSRRERSRSRERERDRGSGRRERSRSKERDSRDKKSDNYEKGMSITIKGHGIDTSISLEDVATRDARTVFAYNLPIKANEQDIKNFFSKAGGVRDVRLIHDRNSRKSKGFGYVEMDTIRAVSEAIQLSGTKFMEKTVMVQASQSEKNAVPSPTASIGPNHSGPTQLFVGSLHVNITEDDLETIFTEFGEVEKVTLARDEVGNSKGFAYVKFKNGDAAKRALVQVNGQELAGRPLKISLVSGGRDATFEDEDGEGSVSLDSSARHVLMAKLAREKENMAFADKLTVTTSNCLLLKNMFSPTDPEVHSNPNFDQEIADDVRDECAKFGRVMHVHCDRRSSEGAVYIRFSQNAEAVKAYTELNGRWFAALQIAAHYIPEKEYLRRFPNAK